MARQMITILKKLDSKSGESVRAFSVHSEGKRSVMFCLTLDYWTYLSLPELKSILEGRNIKILTIEQTEKRETMRKISQIIELKKI